MDVVVVEAPNPAILASGRAALWRLSSYQCAIMLSLAG
jgi:hypothetical protein